MRVAISKVAIGFVAALAWAGCDDDNADSDTDTDEHTHEGDAGGDESDAGEPDASEPEVPHVFALHYSVVADDDNRISYIYLTDTLDLPKKVAINDSREFFGYANSKAVSGHLLVSEEGSVMTKYEISDDLKWKQVDQLSFATYEGLEDVGFWRQWFVDEHTAFMYHNTTDRLVWDPTSFKVIKDVTETTLEPTSGKYDLSGVANRETSTSAWKGPVVRPFNYQGEDAAALWRMSDNSLVVRYDSKTYKEAEVYDVPCPALQIPSQDEDGVTYMSSWGSEAGLSLYGKGPKPCVARFDAEGKYDEKFTSDLTDLTGGRMVGTLRYMRDGKAIATVLHAEELKLDLSKPYAESVEEEIAKHWYLWIFDLEKMTAKQASLKTPVPQAFMSAKFGDRYFLFPYPFMPRGPEMNYEIGTDGSVTPRFETPGFAYSFTQVR